MKSLYLTLFAVPLIALGACAQNDPLKPHTGTGGNGGSGTGAGSAGSNSSPGSGGNSSSPGSAGNNSSSGSAGNNSSGSAGDGDTAGTTGTGGSTAGSSGGSDSSGSAGSPAAGSGGHAGSSSTGGTTGTAGSSGGAGGNGGSGTAGSGSGTISVMDLAGMPNQYGESFMSSFILMPCYAQAQQDCITIPSGAACPNQNAAFEMQGLTQTESFTLGGTMGTMYNMSFTVNGIAEAKYYMGGTRDAGNNPVTGAQDAAGTDTFYRGGAPVAVEHYNIYKLIVRKPDKTELAHYYLNSFPQTTTAYENHQTFPIHYSKTIPVVGGGSIDLYVSDSNCHAVDNCGPGVYAGTCTASRNIPSETNLVIPTKYMGKDVSSINLLTGNKQPYHSQIIHITVTAVDPM